jgi:hypothetical protein
MSLSYFINVVVNVSGIADSLAMNETHILSNTIEVLENVADVMDMVYKPFVYIMGILLNMFFCVLLRRDKNLRKYSLFSYWIGQAICEWIYLFAVLLKWLDQYDVHVLAIDGLCQVVFYCIYVCSFLSGWYLLCIILDRWVWICFGHSSMGIRTKGARCSTVLLGACALLFYSLVLWTVAVQAKPRTDCTFIPHYANILVIFNKIDLIVSTIMPDLLLPFFGSFVFCGLVSRHYKRNRTTSTPATPTTQLRTDRAANREKKEAKISRALLLTATISWLFIIPWKGIRIGDLITLLTGTNMSKPGGERTEVLQRFYHMAYDTSFAIKFFLYLIFSEAFRKAAARYFHRCNQKNNREYRPCEYETSTTSPL